MDEPTRMVVVATCSSEFDAELRRGALQAAGIPTAITTDTGGGTNPQLVVGSSGGVRLLVPEAKAEQARDFLAELDRGDHTL